MKPRFIVVHTTFGYTANSAVKALQDRGLSVHAVIERDGTISRMLPTSTAGQHVGGSRWMRNSGLNSCTLGVELVNFGYVERAWKPNDKAFDYLEVAPHDPEIERDPDGHKWVRFEPGASGKPVLVMTRTNCEVAPDHRADHTDKRWSNFPDEQITALRRLLTSWTQAHGIPNYHIVGHSHIAPRRKLDPGPRFPWQQVEALEPAPTKVWEAPHSVQCHLQRLGLYTGAIDGLVGEKTKEGLSSPSLATILSSYQVSQATLDSLVAQNNWEALALLLRRIP